MTPGLDDIKNMLAQGQVRVCPHSGQVGPGDVFVASSENPVTTLRYAQEAAERGASVIIAPDLDGLPERDGLTVIRTPRVRQVLGELAAMVFKTKDLPIPLVGITGTNGKTTVSYLLEHIFKSIDLEPGVMGTISYRWPGTCKTATLTTPGCWQVHEMLAEMVKAGAGAAIMEVSSHALAQERIAGLTFDLAVFTNLSQDHLDYHHDMESYFQTKTELFRPGVCKQRIINTDDQAGRRLLALYPEAVAYGLAETDSFPSRTQGTYLRGEILENSARGLSLRMHWKDTRWEFHSGLTGRYNASNLLAAQAAALTLGLGPDSLQSLASFAGVPGRLERIPARTRNIFVDFAHTPDALTNVLNALREIGFRRCLVVFGCGGNRDRGKRPLMGRAVSDQADIAIVTSDNPRDEDPLDIINDVRPGLSKATRVLVEPDRRQAIALALAESGPDDVVLVAGKGHEPYQEIKGVKYPYSDQAVIVEWLRENDFE